MSDELGERIPPNDRYAEMATLGGMMLSAAACQDALETAEAADFYQPKHETIFAAIAELAAEGLPTDVIAVGDHLKDAGELARVGGAEYLHELTSTPPTAANAGFYADIVKKKAILRRLVQAGMRIQQMGWASEGDPAELADNARAELEQAAGTIAADVVTIGEPYLALTDKLSAKPRYIETPWREVNELIGGLRPGGLYVVGARPGEGKSIMALQIAQQLAHAGPVAFSSLEMGVDELLTRLISLRGKIHMGPLSRHELGPDEWERVAALRTDIQRMPLYVDARSGVNITQIKGFARTVQRKGKVAGVVVDYLQLITGDARRDRHIVVGEISRQLKILARDLDCPVVALSQLNRDSVGKGRRAPSLGDLRESGSIEQDADVVILLQRALEEDDKPGDRLNVYVAKNRHGKTGMRTLLFEGQYSRLTSTGYGLPPQLPIRED
jgi:replicative DNA helicase